MVKMLLLLMKNKGEVTLFYCPVCNSRAIGKVGNDQYYCWDCFVEYSTTGNQIQIYDIAEDGSLVNLEAEEIGMADIDATIT